MTPAKLMALQKARGEHMELQSYPVDKLAWLYSNYNRDPGEKDQHGNVVRPPAELMPIDHFRTLYVKRPMSTLAAKDSDWDHNMLGAKADRSAWASWLDSKKGT